MARKSERHWCVVPSDKIGDTLDLEIIPDEMTLSLDDFLLSEPVRESWRQHADAAPAFRHGQRRTADIREHRLFEEIHWTGLTPLGHQVLWPLIDKIPAKVTK